jgi:hypothetical protein
MASWYAGTTARVEARATLEQAEVLHCVAGAPGGVVVGKEESTLQRA